MKKLKTMRAGRLVRSVVYTAPSRQPEPRSRGPRRQISTEAQARFNLSKSTDKLEMLIALNFPSGFWWVTLTYDDAHLPEDRKAAGQIMRKYIRKLRAAWKLKGKDLLYIYCTQQVQDDGAWLGECSTRNTGASPSAAVESRLSWILEETPLEKYYLSAKACAGILTRAERRGKELPKELQIALKIQSGALEAMQ